MWTWIAISLALTWLPLGALVAGFPGFACTANQKRLMISFGWITAIVATIVLLAMLVGIGVRKLANI